MGRRGGQDGTTSVPAVVVDYGFGRSIGEDLPEGMASRNIEALVQVVGGDGRRQRVTGRLAGQAWWLMAEGDTVPVVVDEGGTVRGFDRPALEALYEARRDEVRAARKEQSSLRFLLRTDLGLDRRQVRGAVDTAREAVTGALRSWRAAASGGDGEPPATTDAAVAQAAPAGDRPPAPPPPAASVAPAPPQHGVDFATFVAVQAALARERVPAARHDEVAVRFGVPAGHWAPAAEAWHRVVRSDPAAGQAFGAAYQAALRG